MFRLALASTPGSETYNQIFMTAVQLFPDNPTANLNAACIALMQRDVQTAATYLEKAPKVPETILAKEFYAFLKTTMKKQSTYSDKLKKQDYHKRIIICN